VTQAYGGGIMYMFHPRRKNMDRTTIMLPPELKTMAANQLKKKGIPLGQYIQKALQRMSGGIKDSVTVGDRFGVNLWNALC